MNPERSSADVLAMAERLVIEGEKLRYPAQAAIALEAFKGANERGALAIKSSMLINGGSAVGLLTLIGNLAHIPQAALQIPLIANALILFVVGVWCALIASGFAYLTAICVVAKRNEDLTPSDKRKKVSARITNILAVVFVTASISCFTYGCWKSYFAILQLRHEYSTLAQTHFTVPLPAMREYWSIGSTQIGRTTSRLEERLDDDPATGPHWRALTFCELNGEQKVPRQRARPSPTMAVNVACFGLKGAPYGAKLPRQPTSSRSGARGRMRSLSLRGKKRRALPSLSSGGASPC
jgi:hypothetical protein